MSDLEGNSIMRPIRTLFFEHKHIYVYCGPEVTQKIFLRKLELEGFRTLTPGVTPYQLEKQKLYWIRNDLTVGYLDAKRFCRASSADNPGCVRIDFEKYIEGKDYVINRPRNEYKQLFDCDGILLYEGMVNNDGLPNGPGTMYYQNGKVYREGLFSDGGFISGHEYRASGMPRFAGLFQPNLEGINYPRFGTFFNESGYARYQGPFKVRETELYPIVVIPAEYGTVEDSDSPSIRNLFDETLVIVRSNDL